MGGPSFTRMGRSGVSRDAVAQTYQAPIRPPSTPPTRGPKTGTHAYDQSLEPLPLIGSRACTMRGPRSRAGLMAYPVGPPRLAPMPTTMRATASGPRPDGDLPADTIQNTSTNVPRTSVTKFQPYERIAGPVENTASLVAGSASSSKCFLYAR